MRNATARTVPGDRFDRTPRSACRGAIAVRSIALLAYYAERSGRQVDDFDYYLVLARWKLAIVLEQGYQRAGGDVKLQSFGATVVDLMRRAAELAKQGVRSNSPPTNARSPASPRG